jgi:AcrR family transcriptional regulator
MTDESASPTASGSPATWREAAVARSLDPARARAEKRVQRFLDAALELMEADAGREFTVQEVVERSGQSLRSFYQYFAGKHELLLALFEESVRSTADHLRTVVDEETEPLARLKRFVTEYYQLCRPTSPRRKSAKKGPLPVMLVEFAQQLLTAHPNEAAQAYVPLVTLLGELLDEAAEAGVVRPGLRHTAVSGVVLEAIMFNTFSATISGDAKRDPAERAGEELWDLLIHGIGAP